MVYVWYQLIIIPYTGCCFCWPAWELASDSDTYLIGDLEPITLIDAVYASLKQQPILKVYFLKGNIFSTLMVADNGHLLWIFYHHNNRPQLHCAKQCDKNDNNIDFMYVVQFTTRLAVFQSATCAHTSAEHIYFQQ